MTNNQVSTLDQEILNILVDVNKQLEELVNRFSYESREFDVLVGSIVSLECVYENIKEHIICALKDDKVEVVGEENNATCNIETSYEGI